MDFGHAPADSLPWSAISSWPTGDGVGGCRVAILMPAKCSAVTKKTIRDRVIKLIDLFAKGDDWKKRM